MLSRYLDGEVSPSASRSIRAHLQGCEKCAEALARLEWVDASVRQRAQPAGETPDVAGGVTRELVWRGAFFGARVAWAKRRLVGERFVPGRMALALGAAAGIVLLVLAGMDYASRRDWARRTEPVLADADHVLVRLVLADPEDEAAALARARAEAPALAERLADVRKDARSDMAADLAYVERTFVLLARGEVLPPDVAAKLADGEIRDRVCRLRDEVAAGL